MYNVVANLVPRAPRFLVTWGLGKKCLSRVAVWSNLNRALEIYNG